MVEINFFIYLICLLLNILITYFCIYNAGNIFLWLKSKKPNNKYITVENVELISMLSISIILGSLINFLIMYGCVAYILINKVKKLKK